MRLIFAFDGETNGPDEFVENGIAENKKIGK